MEYTCATHLMNNKLSQHWSTLLLSKKCGKSHTHLRGARKSVIQNCTKDALHIQYKTFYDLGTAFADKCKRLQPVNGPEQKERWNCLNSIIMQGVPSRLSRPYHHYLRWALSDGGPLQLYNKNRSPVVVSWHDKKNNKMPTSTFTSSGCVWLVLVLVV